MFPNNSNVDTFAVPKQCIFFVVAMKKKIVILLFNLYLCCHLMLEHSLHFCQKHYVKHPPFFRLPFLAMWMTRNILKGNPIFWWLGFKKFLVSIWEELEQEFIWFPTWFFQFHITLVCHKLYALLLGTTSQLTAVAGHTLSC